MPSTTYPGTIVGADGQLSMPNSTGATGQSLRLSSTTGLLEWYTPAAGGVGDVVGPSSATDNAIVRFDSTTGKLVQNSAVTIDDSGNIAASGDISISKSGAATMTINSTSANQYTGLAFSESGAAKAYVLSINSTWSESFRRNYIEFYSVNGGCSFWTNSTKRLDIDIGGTATFSGSATVVGYLNLGGITSSHTMLKRNGTAVNFRLGDDSADAPITAAAITASGSLKLGIKTIATLPSAASSSGERYQVSDSATIANRIAFSNGTAWYYEGTAVAV